MKLYSFYCRIRENMAKNKTNELTKAFEFIWVLYDCF